MLWQKPPAMPCCDLRQETSCLETCPGSQILCTAASPAGWPLSHLTVEWWRPCGDFLPATHGFGKPVGPGEYPITVPGHKTDLGKAS